MTWIVAPIGWASLSKQWLRQLSPTVLFLPSLFSFLPSFPPPLLVPSMNVLQIHSGLFHLWLPSCLSAHYPGPSQHLGRCQGTLASFSLLWEPPSEAARGPHHWPNPPPVSPWLKGFNSQVQAPLLTGLIWLPAHLGLPSGPCTLPVQLALWI